MSVVVCGCVLAFDVYGCVLVHCVICMVVCLCIVYVSVHVWQVVGTGVRMNVWCDVYVVLGGVPSLAD